MKHLVIAFITAAAVGPIDAAPAFAQVVIFDNQPSDVYSVDRDTESDFLNAWNRKHDARNHWDRQRDSFGPEDVVTLLEERGYKVRNVRDVGARYLVNATRGGDNLLVSVSRSGDIMGVVHDQY